MSRKAAVIAVLVLSLAAHAHAAPRGVTAGIEAARATAARNKVEADAQARRKAQTRLRTQHTAHLRMIAARNALARVEERRRALAAEAALHGRQQAHSGASPGKALANYKKWVASKPHWQTFQGVVPPSELRRFEPKRETPLETPTPCRTVTTDPSAPDTKPRTPCTDAGS